MTNEDTMTKIPVMVNKILNSNRRINLNQEAILRAVS